MTDERDDMGNLLFYVNPPASLPLEGVFYYDFFASDAGYDKTIPTDSTLEVTYNGLHIVTSSSVANPSVISKHPDNFFYKLTWDKRRELKLSVKLTEDPDYPGTTWIITGDTNIDRHFGLLFDGHKLYATVGDGTHRKDTQLNEMFWPTKDNFRAHIKFFPLSHIEFWLDGELTYSEDEYLPQGETSAEYLMKIDATSGSNPPVYTPVELYIPYLELYQEKQD